MEKELTPEDIIEGKEIASGPSAPRNDDGETPFRPHYIAHTKIQTLALLDEEHKGSNWYRWRCVLRFVRTYFRGSPEVKT
jgi:hypothetical protein